MEIRIGLLYDVKMEGFSFYWFQVNEERIMYLATIDKNGNKWTHKLTDGDEASKRSEMLPIPGITGGQ